MKINKSRVSLLGNQNKGKFAIFYLLNKVNVKVKLRFLAPSAGIAEIAKR